MNPYNTAEDWLEKRLHYRFLNPELFRQSLTHRSAAAQNNERLEFLGDAILNVVIAENIYRARPEASEGDLSKLRASLVKDDSLAKLAAGLQLGEYLTLGSGERKTGGHHRQSILADALEAVFGAVLLDGGFEAAKAIIERVYDARLNALPDVEDLRDPKTRLQEWLQARKMELPIYDLVREMGKDHKKRFEVSCSVAEFSAVTHGEASTRRKAEQKSARKMFAAIAKTSARQEQR